MKFLNKKTTWTNAELIPLKLAIASIYLILGALFSEKIKSWNIPILVLFLITVIWSLRLWINKMKTK